MTDKPYFIVSTQNPALAKGSSLFVADPFFKHLLDINPELAPAAELQLGSFIRKGPEDLYRANTLLWSKHKQYVPILASLLNNIHDTKFPCDFWRRALSMGLMRHMTMLYDFFMICETQFIQHGHDAYVLSTDCFYIPVDYNEHRWFLQHSHFGQEQLLSMYLKQFYPGIGQDYSNSYRPQYDLHRIITRASDYNPSVGIMGSLFDETAINDLLYRSKGAIAPIGFDFDLPAHPSISYAKRTNLKYFDDSFDRFDRFFFSTLPSMLPREFVENFELIYRAASTKFDRYTNLKFVVSETFIGETYESIALAILKARGVTIVYNEHNYCEYQFYSSILEQQTSFADIFAAHGNYSAPIKNKVSTGSLFPFYERSLAENRKYYDILFVCGLGEAKYSNYTHAYVLTAEHALINYDFKLRFFNALPQQVMNKILYRAYPSDPQWILSYDDKYMMRQFLPSMLVDDHSVNGRTRMRQSRLIITEYLATTYLESMSMNIPTVMFFKRESYHFNDRTKDYLDDLCKVGICHDDPVKAAEFVAQISQNPEAWWSQPDVQAAKDRFLERNLGKPEYLTDFLLRLSEGKIVFRDDKSQHFESSAKNPLSSFRMDEKLRVYLNNENGQPRFDYTDGQDVEERIYRILRETKDLGIFSRELCSRITDWPTEYHFSSMRHNLLRHIRFKSTDRILELGCGCGAITRQLGESGAAVTAIEGSPQRARAAAERCRDLPNVRVHCANFQDICFTEQYDVVTLIGVLEYSPQYFASDDPIGECLQIACTALKPDGVLIIAIENQLGLKYFSGYREDHADIPYFGIEDRYSANTAVTFGRRELKRILRGAGLQEIEFHYPFPDYKVPKAVFTEDAFNTPGFCPEEIIRQLKSRDYCGELRPVFDEQLAIPVICRNGMMQDFSNSFLVLGSKDSIKPALRDPDILATMYTTERINPYNVHTTFIKGKPAIVARKKRLAGGPSPVSPHDVLIHQPKTQAYVPGHNLEAEYRRCVALKDFETMSRLLSLQLTFLSREATASSVSCNPAEAPINPEYFDCVPSNLIINNDELHYIDTEWILTRPATLGTLLLRTVDALHDLGKDLPELQKDNLVRILNQAGFQIDGSTFNEYKTLIDNVHAQVYDGTNLGSASWIEEPDPIWQGLQNMLSKLEYLPKPESVLDRLRTLLERMLIIRDGKRPAGDLEKNGEGPSTPEEYDLCRSVQTLIGNDKSWKPVSDFMEHFIRRGSEIPGSSSLHIADEKDPLKQFRQFDYGNEFKHFICPNPLLYMELGQNGDVSTCCYLPFSFGNINSDDIRDVWNSSVAQELRRSILSGEYCYCDKRKCAAMQEAVLPVKAGNFQYQIPYQLIERNKRYGEPLRDSISSGTLDVSSGPKIISFEDDPSCNLSCPSCRMYLQVLGPEESAGRFNLQCRLLNSFGKTIHELWLSGAGDPFASSSYRRLLQKYDFDKNPNLKLRIDTNGMLLNEQTWSTVLERVRNRVKLIAVSVDAATAATYAAIRRGGNFPALLENLRFIGNIPERKKGIGFIIRMIVQQKNFKEMKQFVELGRSLGVDGVIFSVIQNWGAFSPEEYRDQAVHLAGNPHHGELCSILRDTLFEDPLVYLGNLSQLRHELTESPGKIRSENPADGAPPKNFPSTEAKRARVIAFYLPQFHPIPENDMWWGKGFTEWTNVGKAQPLFEGHYQPHVPADLGYYDLRVHETRQAQTDLARQYGIEAFCYWHYWFAGHRLLERPFDEVLRSGQPDFPFCLGWANQTWSGIWHGAPDRILVEQTYPGLPDYRNHFNALLPAFRDSRHVKVNGKLLFLIYSPQNLPNSREFTAYWQQLAREAGLEGFHFVAHLLRSDPELYGCDTCVDGAPFATMEAPLLPVRALTEEGVPKVFHYAELVRHCAEMHLHENEYPLVMPNWDNTPRSGMNGVVLHGSTPELFRKMMEDAVTKAERKQSPDERIIFLKAWNEWAEGNHLEPDLRHGHGYLKVVRETVDPISVTAAFGETIAASTGAEDAISPVGSNGDQCRVPKPWTAEYYQYRAQFNETAIQDGTIVELFRKNCQLPKEFAIGLDERSIEYPWFLSRAGSSSRKVLDAGSALNHPEIICHPHWKDKDLTIVTLAPEAYQFSLEWLHYVYSDLRDLPFENAAFDEIVCISTLEHVGMDNTLFTNDSSYHEERTIDFILALTELKRVLKPGGTLLLTVPFGRYMNYRDFQQFDRRLLDSAAESFGARMREESFYYYTPGGWRLAESPEECSNVEYSAYALESHWGGKPTSTPEEQDGAAAARAVACCVWQQ